MLAVSPSLPAALAVVALLFFSCCALCFDYLSILCPRRARRVALKCASLAATPMLLLAFLDSGMMAHLFPLCVFGSMVALALIPKMSSAKPAAETSEEGA